MKPRKVSVNNNKSQLTVLSSNYVVLELRKIGPYAVIDVLSQVGLFWLQT